MTVLTFLSDTAQILGVLWVIFAGGKSIFELKIIGKPKASTITNFLLGLILFAVATLIFHPAYTSAGGDSTPPPSPTSLLTSRPSPISILTPSPSPTNIIIPSPSPTNTFVPSSSPTPLNFSVWFSCETCGGALNIKLELLKVTFNSSNKSSSWVFHTENHSNQDANNLHITSFELTNTTNYSTIDCGSSSTQWVYTAQMYWMYQSNFLVFRYRTEHTP